MAPSGSIEELGNTISNSSPLRISPSKQWCFTFNNYTEENLAPILDILETKCELYVFQEETGENGTPHLQGQIILTTKGRPIELFRHISTKIHFEKTKDLKASIKYCCKEDTRTGRVWSNFPLPKAIKLIKPEDFHIWQVELMERLKITPDDREIFWYVDKDGGKGKSSFCKYLCAKKHAIVLCGKASDMKQGIMVFEDKKGFYPEIIIIDLPRTFDCSYLSYTGIEEIKNGCFFSPKYEGGMCIFNNPHIIVFSNEMPDTRKLSTDKWIIVELT